MRAKVLASLLVFVLGALPAYAAQVIVVNGDAPGLGFNNPAPATPVGGNTGTTVGQQALNVFERAAEIWGSRLVSDQPIYIIAFFTPLPCTATGAVLGAAGPNWYFANITPARGGKALSPNTWYPAALAEKITRQDIVADPSDPFEIITFFNSNLGGPNCLTGSGWYYGFDNEEPAGRIDLLTVVLHEFGHGLGFTVGPTNANTGARAALDWPSVWESQMLDTTTGKRWVQMTNPERAASARNNHNLVWAGQKASNVVPSTLDFGIELDVHEPSLGSFEAWAASFGSRVGPGQNQGFLVAPADGGGVSPNDGCEPFPNDGANLGAIFLIDRGTCPFAQKALNAQAAGASGVVIANNVAGPLLMGGTVPDLEIPVVGITQALGAALRSAAPASVELRGNPRLHAGTVANLPRLYAPSVFSGGSSVSHWDTTTFPNMLMEPSINADLTSSVKNPDDLTWSLLRDIGW